MKRKEKVQRPKTEDCEHIWDEEVTSMYSNEHYIAVKCKLCGMPGEQDLKTGETFWPAT